MRSHTGEGDVAVMVSPTAGRGRYDMAILAELAGLRPRGVTLGLDGTVHTCR